AVTGVTVGLESLVPARGEEFVELVREGFTSAGHGGESTQLVFAHHDVAVGAGPPVPQAEAGREAEPFAVDARAGLFGDLEPNHRPRLEGGRQFGAGARGRAPSALGAKLTRTGRLRRPLQVNAGTQGARN